jgi:hypothetical protein
MKRLTFSQLIVMLSWMSVASAGITLDVDKKLETLNPSNCSSSLTELAVRLKSASYAEENLRGLFLSKIALHEKIKSFARDEYSLECATAARSVFKTIRTLEDYNTIQNASLVSSESAFVPGNPTLQKHPSLPDFEPLRDLRSGDILLTRGNAHTSGAIANLGEFDTVFSHMSVVYRDPQNKLWTVEAHIEVGSFVRPIEDHIKDGNVRTVVFRYEDAAKAQAAAKFVFEKVKKASETKGNIDYDFSFDSEDSEKLFCSEVIAHAFKEVTDGKVVIPFYPSRLDQRKQAFVKRLGIEVKESFIPADIEVDPRFTLVAEWRNAQKMSESLKKDAVIRAMYKWTEEESYHLVQASSGKSLLYRNFAWPMRRIPLLKNLVKEQLPLNMTRKLVGLFGVIDASGELLLSVLDEKIASQKDASLADPEEMYQILNDFRLESSKGSKKLHRYYRPMSENKL